MQQFVVLPDLEPEADVVALAAVDAAGLDVGLEQHVAGVEVGQAHAPGMLAFGQMHAAAVVEIETQPFGPSCVGNSAGAG